MKHFDKLLCAAILALGFGAAQAADLAVIVHPDNPLAKLSKEELKRIYLGKDKTFPGGDKIQAADQPEGSPGRGRFYTAVVERSDAQMRSYWSQLVFAGKDTPPEVVGNDGAIKKWVAEQKNRIGYVDGGAVDGSVKVVMRLP
jgi:ABC-type phosphate transport system substrate-binding protein